MTDDVCTAIYRDEAAIKTAAGQDSAIWWQQVWNYSLANDYSMHCRYRRANEADKAKGAIDVVMLGDSITEGWSGGDPSLFRPGVVNRGIGGQTSEQMVLRFRSDVVDLRPRVVHIMAGTNDIAGNTGPNELVQYQNNIAAMIDLAKANGIKVILGSVPPSNRMPWKPELRPASWVARMNDWLRAYASERGVDYVDYHAVLAGSAGELDPKYGSDGVHPDANGYAKMRPLIDAAIRRSLTTAP